MTILTHASGCSQKNRCPAPVEQLDARARDPRREQLGVAVVDDVVGGAGEDQRRRRDLAVDALEPHARSRLGLPAGLIRRVRTLQREELVDELGRRVLAERVLDEAAERHLGRERRGLGEQRAA